MPEDIRFQGFTKECLTFFLDLEMNNETAWFNSHRTEYETYVLEPSRRFVTDMGERLAEIAPGIVADPRVNRSLFRINRDTRFSRDKTPYKTHLGIWFWEGSLSRMECSGFYFHLEPERLLLAAGVYQFTKSQLDKYREYVVHSKHGKALTDAIDAVVGNGYELGGEHYKRIPRGYDPNHKNARFLLYNGLGVMIESEIPDECMTPGLIDYCFERFEHMLPLHQWLLNLTE